MRVVRCCAALVVHSRQQQVVLRLGGLMLHTCPGLHVHSSVPA